MKAGLLTDVYPKWPKIKEAVMFGFACAILLFTIVFILAMNDVTFLISMGFGDVGDVTNVSSEDSALPGAEIFVAMAYIFTIVMTYLALGMFIFFILVICWTVGLIISAILAFRIRRIPCWMHITSVILALCYLFFLSARVIWLSISVF